MTSRQRKSKTVGKTRRRLRSKASWLPSALTVGNLFAGFFAITSVLNGQYDNAAVAIGIAVVLDVLDGRVARMANMTSDFGMQLDSLADAISFGVAPAILMYSWGLSGLGRFASFTAFFYLICGVTRLARFNVQSKNLRAFSGMPIPAAGGYLAATVHLFVEPMESMAFTVYLVSITYLAAFLMISTVRYPSLKHLSPIGGKSHLNAVGLALIVAGILLYSQPVLMLLASAYLLSGLVSHGYQIWRQRVSPDAVHQDLETDTT